MKDITPRDFFAAQYMTAAIEKARTLIENEINALIPGNCGGLTYEELGAALAFRYADQMIKRRCS